MVFGERLRSVVGLPGGPVVPVVRLVGVIGVLPMRRGGLSLSALDRPLRRAFGTRGAKAVALVIDSPGGSAAQASLIATRIRALAEEKKLPVLAFVEDIAASGGYWLACAADEIHADACSILGSIGVISAGFGFTEAIRRLGVERRVHTKGDRKAFLDPFREERPEDLAVLDELQEDLYARFKAFVRERRGERLRIAEDELFSGRVWSGERAARLGLVDGLGEMRGILRARYGEKLRLRPVNPPRQPWWRGLSPAGASEALADALVHRIEERLLRSRYGL